MARVETGTARPTFPYSDYSLDELNKLYPQYPAEDVVATQTPEETYAKFREYLKNNNVEGALSLIFERNKKDYNDAFYQAKKENTIFDLYKKLPQNLEKVSCYDTICTYKVDSDTFIRFQKEINGVWLIESL